MMNKDVKVIDLKRSYDKDFVPSQEYLDSMPDLQNGEFVGLAIPFVGIQNFKVPVTVRQKDGGTQQVLATIYAENDLDSEHFGINMSRLIREWIPTRDVIFDINRLEGILRDYQKKMNSFDAHVLMNFPYYLWLPSLRSRDENGNLNGGYQVYNVTFDCNIDKTGEFKKVAIVDYIYQSVCTCSTALAQHAAITRGVYAAPHNQRSVCRVSVESEELIWIEDIIEHCRKALPNETMVFCKREDEQAHGEMGAQPMFVEEAVRRMAEELNKDERIRDWRVVCVHRESIHNFDCHSIITKGIPGSIFNHHINIGEYKDLMV